MSAKDQPRAGGSVEGRVIAYIDGLNLYFGLRASGMRAHLWLDPVALVQSLLHPGQTLARVKYFTSRISGGRQTDSPQERSRREQKRVRQSLYLDALGTRLGLETHYGHFLDKPEGCRSCGARWLRSEEKKTDVLIASHMLTDVFSDACDHLLLVSGDTDLAPPISIIRERFPDHRVTVAFPPGRSAAELKWCAHAYFLINKAKVRQAQLPYTVVTTQGHELRRPPEWS